MARQTTTRAFTALTTLIACAGIALSPAVATAAAKKHTAKHHRHHHKVAALKEAKNTKPGKRVGASRPAASATGLGDTTDLGPTSQLAAMRTAIAAAPAFYPGHSTGCASVTSMLTSQPGLIMAGNFRDAGGNCYVWLNLQQSSMLTGSEICKTTLHEMGHLNGLQHSPDKNDVMYAPFRADPIPAPCQAQPASSIAARKAVKASKASKASKTTKAGSICPPGAQNADYCQSVKATPKHRRAHHARSHARA